MPYLWNAVAIVSRASMQAIRLPRHMRGPRPKFWKVALSIRALQPAVRPETVGVGAPEARVALEPIVRSRLDRKSQENYKCTVKCDDIRV
jgi:hypothetical protein